MIEVIFAKLDPKFKKEWVTAMREDVIADPLVEHCYHVNEEYCLERWGWDEQHIGYSYRVERNSMGELGEPYKHYLTTENLCEWYGGDVGRYYTTLTGEQALPGGIDDWIEENC